MQPQQFAGLALGLADPLGQRLRTHAVLDGQDASLEEVALLLVRILRGVWWNGPGLFGEGQVGIAGAVGRLHRLVARQRGGNAKFLLFVIQVGNSMTERRLDKSRNQTEGPKINLLLDGWLRPVLAPNADSRQRLRPSDPTASSERRSCDRAWRNSLSGATSTWDRAIWRKVSSVKSRLPEVSIGHAIPFLASHAANRSVLNVRPS